jgi:AcrR family transcriptional regulator
MQGVTPPDGRSRGRAVAGATQDRPAQRRGAKQDPRGRMAAAMLALVGEQGYAASTVADVIARAGASRKTFYEHFEDRQACFATVSDEVAGQWLQRIGAAVEGAAGTEQATGSFVDELFGAALASPAALRILAVEQAAVGPGGVERRERFLGELSGVLGRAFGERKDGSLLARALAGSVLRIPYVRAARGARVRRPRRSELLALAPDVAGWLARYGSARQPAIAAAGGGGEPAVGGRAPGTLSLGWRAGERRGLPRGESSVSHSFVVHNQRERLLDAIANLSAVKGYGAVTIPEIVHEAAVSVQAFYEHFSGREDAFAVAYELGHRKALAIVERAYDAQTDWPAAVRAGLEALLDFLASEPSFARLALVDAPTAGPKASVLARDATGAYAEMLRPGLERSPNGKPVPEIAVEATAGALQELCCAYVATARARELPSLLELAAHIALTPFGAGGLGRQRRR